MNDNVIPSPGAAPRATPLADAMRQLAFGFQLQSGQEATHIMLPRKSLRSEVKPFIEALCAEEPDLGPAYRVMGRIVEHPDGVPACTFAGLTVVMYDGRSVVVGRADGFDLPDVDVVEQ